MFMYHTTQHTSPLPPLPLLVLAHCQNWSRGSPAGRGERDSKRPPPPHTHTRARTRAHTHAHTHTRTHTHTHTVRNIPGTLTVVTDVGRPARPCQQVLQHGILLTVAARLHLAANKVVQEPANQVSASTAECPQRVENKLSCVVFLHGQNRSNIPRFRSKV